MKTIKGELRSGRTNPSPTIACWIPEQNDKRVGLVILPGGGYGMLAGHEGEGFAEYFVKAGIACFVVSYRLGSAGHRHPEMLEDSLSAVRTVRARADEFGIDPERIGIIGSSAGGHLAAHTLVAWDQYESETSLRPDFGILCYPVITTSRPHGHTGSITNLAGENPSPELLHELSCEKHVSAATPPCFLWHTVEDACVRCENSMLFASALRQHDVPFELHLYPRGRHGLGLGANFGWEQDCLRWIHETVEQD